MSTSQPTTLSPAFMRRSGLALLVSGVLTVVCTIAHPDEVAHPEVVNGALWLTVHSGMMIATVLMLFGLTGLYAKQAEQTGRWGALGYVPSLIGTALFIAFFYFENLIMPALAATPAVLDAIFAGPLGLMLLITRIIFALGFILTGIAIFRSVGLPRWAAPFLIG